MISSCMPLSISKQFKQGRDKSSIGSSHYRGRINEDGGHDVKKDKIWFFEHFEADGLYAAKIRKPPS